MYLPKFSYFGDYQILRPLKSNIVFKSVGYNDPKATIKPTSFKSPLMFDPDVMFMCVNKDDLLNLCELFPETKNNLLKIALERRKKFMVYKKLNSIKYWTARGKAPMETRKSHRRNDLVKWVK